MFSALAAVKASGAVARIDLARSASELVLQGVIAYVHGRLFQPRELSNPEPRLARLIDNATPQAYLRGELSAVYAPLGHTHSGLSYHQLIRCTLERWDNHAQRFVDSSTCRQLKSENAALFPAGDFEATQRMAGILWDLRLSVADQDHANSEPSPQTERA